MKLLVASRYGLSQVDTETGKVSEPCFLSLGWTPYGISWNNHQVFVAARSDLGRGEGSGAQAVLVFDKSFGLQSELILGTDVFSDLHQVIWYDDRLWVMSTGLNQVVIFGDLGGGNSYEIWKPNPDPRSLDRLGHPLTDWNHFNSIWFEDDRVFLVAHNFDRPSEVWEFSYPERRFIGKRPGGSMAHNVCRINGELTTLSNCGKIEQVKVGRGLAVGGGKIFVGVSDRIEDREQRKYAEGYVAVFDTNWNRERDFLIGRGEIRELRLLDAPDIAHHQQVF